MKDIANLNPTIVALFVIIVLQIILILSLLIGRKKHNVLALPTLLAVFPQGGVSLTVVLLAIILLNTIIILSLICSSKWEKTEKTEQWLSKSIEKLSKEEKKPQKQPKIVPEQKEKQPKIKPQLPDDDEEDDDDNDTYYGEDTVDADKIGR